MNVQRLSPGGGAKQVTRRLFPLTLMVIGVAFVAAGGYTAVRGFDAKDQVRRELAAQAIKTPADASIPNAPVDGVATARSMAEIVDHHARQATGGLAFAEMGRYMNAEGTALGTNDEGAAVKGANGRPLPNPIRNVAFEASSVRTGLYTSVMAFEVGNLVIGLGAMVAVVGVALGGLGIALGALVVPALSRRTQAEPAFTGLGPSPIPA